MTTQSLGESQMQMHVILASRKESQEEQDSGHGTDRGAGGGEEGEEKSSSFISVVLTKSHVGKRKVIWLVDSSYSPALSRSGGRNSSW